MKKDRSTKAKGRAVKLRKAVKAKLTKRAELAALLLIFTIFGLKVLSYTHVLTTEPANLGISLSEAYKDIKFRVGELKYFGKCPSNELKIDIGQEYLCRDAIRPSIYQTIYDTAPRSSEKTGYLYQYLDAGSIQAANQLVRNQYSVPGHQSVTLPANLTWQEDPYNSKSWSSDLYSLTIFKDLLYGAETTRQSIYTDKLLQQVNSFLAAGSKLPASWDDNDVVAQRAMMLSEVWWNIRSNNSLPIGTSNKVLAAIQQTGDYLSKPSHYDAASYPDVDEASALYMLGVSFPKLPGSAQWLAIGKDRLSDVTQQLINPDGTVVSMSPSQQLEVLAKYWDIYQFSVRNQQKVQGLQPKVIALEKYSAYLVQPDLKVPVLGRSAPTRLTDVNEFAQIAKSNSQFQYVITQGKKGSPPRVNSVAFASGGQTIIRSGWLGKDYTQQTQLIFNYGITSTQSDHLDSLDINLYGEGKAVLPGSVNPSVSSKAIQSYFAGTASHNTVVVDGQNQIAGGRGEKGLFVSTKNYSSQSATDSLNSGVTHERQVVLIGSKTVVVIDNLKSSKSHTYQDLFHIFPGAQVSKKGLQINAKDGQQSELTISQLVTNGMRMTDTYDDLSPAHVGGICSLQTNSIVPCHQISYTESGTDVSFVTVLNLGGIASTSSYVLKGHVITILQGGKTYTIPIAESKAAPISAKVSRNSVPKPQETVVDSFNDSNAWQVSGGSLANSQDTYQIGHSALSLATTSDLKDATMTRQVVLDLSNKNLLLRMKIPSIASLKNLDFLLYSGASSYAEVSLQSSYQTLYNNDQSVPGDYSANGQNTGWVTISLGKGSQRDVEGNWEINGSSFNWANITKIVFRIGSQTTTPAQLLLGVLSTTPQQSQGKTAIIFDDGTSSILSAAQSMQRYGFKGSVGVIGKYSADDTNGYLSVSQLKSLRSKGWSLINHSFYHQDAVTQYYDANSLSELKDDILSGALFLEQNGLDSDPNWYIYPHGSTNSAIESVVGKYYRFARSELTAPEVYPFGNPLAVKVFVVENTTPVSSIINAVADANAYKQTLLITFHRIQDNSSSQSGYSINSFNEFLVYLKKSSTNVMTLNQLDASNNVPVEKLTVVPGHESQLTGRINVTNPTLLQRVISFF